MKITKKIYRITLALTCGLAGTLQAQSVYVANYNYGTIGEYTASGAAINTSLISGLKHPEGIAIAGNDLFVANSGNGTIGEYTTSGVTVNASLISGLDNPWGIAISGTNLFVANYTNNGTVGEYTTSGAPVNAALISGLYNPTGIAISGTNLFVAANMSGGAYGYIAEYTTSGATVNAALIRLGNFPQGIAFSGNDLYVAYGENVGEFTISGSLVNSTGGLAEPIGIAISGNDLYVGIAGYGNVREFTTSVATVNASLIYGLNYPTGIAISLPSAPVLSSPGFSNGQFQMAVSGSSNQTYTVQMATNLLSPNWVSLLVTNPPSGSFSFTDPNATNQQQFYRVETAQ